MVDDVQFVQADHLQRLLYHSIVPNISAVCNHLGSVSGIDCGVRSDIPRSRRPLQASPGYAIMRMTFVPFAVAQLNEEENPWKPR